MKTRTLWQVSITINREADEAAAALLERLFGQPGSIYAREDQPYSVATVYSSQPAAQIQARREALNAGLDFIASCGLDLGPAKVVIRRVPREDYATSWRKHFKTIEIGSALLIKPSWSKRRRRPGQAVVNLDPGLSFGTGQHPTTSFCLRQLVRSRKAGQQQSFLDIGTGSGILAIGASKLGYAPVMAFDNDPTSVRVAQANARKNRVETRIRFRRQDLTALPVESRIRYDVVCANLILDLLLSEAERILNRLAPHGRLVLAGLLTNQFATVERAYAARGLKLQVARTEGEWRSGAFQRPL